MGRLGAVLWPALEYSTTRNLVVRAPLVGVVYRLTQLLIVAALGWSIFYQKGYQASDDVEFATTMKVKGVASTMGRRELPWAYRGIWDASDYLISSHDAFFITTNAIISNGQRYGVCPEDPTEPGAGCERDEDCAQGSSVPGGNGVLNGTCDLDWRSCLVEAWCPVETDQLMPELRSRPLLEGAVNFTVFIQTFVTFPKFHLRTTNVEAGRNISVCRYHETSDPHCPVFVIGQMVEAALEDSSLSFNEFAVLGGVVKVFRLSIDESSRQTGKLIEVTVNWECDLDWDEPCLPTYRFRRLAATTSIRGWSFRTAHEYRDEEKRLHRDMIKNYGILFLVSVQGTAAKFSWRPLLLRIGSGVGLLTIARFFVDFVLIYLLPRRKIYKEHKFDKLTFRGIGLKRGGAGKEASESKESPDLEAARSQSDIQLDEPLNPESDVRAAQKPLFGSRL